MPVSERYRMSLDPGLGGTGWAVWKGESWNRLDAPVATGIYECNIRKMDWVARALKIATQFEATVLKYHPEEVYVEWPKFYDNAEGHMVMKKGSIFQLTFLIGCFAHVAAPEGCRTILVPVNDWKGQLPKDIVAERILRKLGIESCADFDSHVWDAVGIGLFAKGVNVNV